MTTSPRRGWRATLDSPLLRSVVVCGSLSVLLSATAGASGVAGRDVPVASAGSGVGFAAERRCGDVFDTGSQETCIADAVTVVLWESETSSPRGLEETAPDSTNDDDVDVDGDVDDEDRLAPSIPLAGADGDDARHLTQLDANPSLSLESDGHSLRAPPG